MQKGTRVYAPGTRVTHSFEMSEKTMTMSDRDRDSPLRDRSDRSEERSQSPLVSRPKSPGQHRKMQPGGRPGGASGATKELDDLMASLNDFKVENNNNQSSNYQATTTSRFTESTQRNYTGSSPSPARDVWDKGAVNRGSPLSDSNHNRDSVDRGGATSRTSDLSDNNTCAACNKTVSGQVITALGKVWHIECFRCAHCDTPLRTQPFFEKAGKAYCERDYHELFAMKCQKCKGPIKDTCYTALEASWHPECFCCARCNTAFGEEPFHEREGRPFCDNCYLASFAPQCQGCRKPISGTYLTALDAQWHRDCFVCTDCRKPFESGSFFELDGRPYCEQHYHSQRGSVCGTCQQPISGRCITAMGKKFHPDHFVCSYCVRPLNKGTFKEHAGKPWCHNCFERLYGSNKEGQTDDGADM
ncbi:transforming growth factor beta-1-induced transcript 1 protein-like isoform X2 [Paramacrobiotus metropolitanus]|uniref:transforming growth factor beta-1-induced transcript 1 protein-like isoform X2 n=1 Tax=Paramacrobiotus metropolitanus TaxID=2943436 RepID=UPI002445BF37|nr:transforming growth factor beta-1-induced transcript 1 protein-like isoform X2 [Paramacrobiotus metropolitanus]